MKLTLENHEALVIIEFLLRFRDNEKLEILHEAEGANFMGFVCNDRKRSSRTTFEQLQRTTSKCQKKSFE